jgi:hypothetical protein
MIAGRIRDLNDAFRQLFIGGNKLLWRRIDTHDADMRFFLEDPTNP